MKSVIYSFDPVLYPWPLLVTKKFDSKELGALFYVVNTDNDLEEGTDTFTPNPNTIARTIQVVSKETNLRYVIVMLCRPAVIGNGTIAHEAYHFANMIAEEFGFFPDKMMHDEPVAYLLQWAANCIASVKEGRPTIMDGKLIEQI